MFDEILYYIHLNPITVGFVTNPEDRKYSSASEFFGSNNKVKRLIELNFSS